MPRRVARVAAAEQEDEPLQVAAQLVKTAGGVADEYTPFLEIANVGSQVLKKVEIELRGTLIGYAPVALTLLKDQKHATGETKNIDIGALAPLEEKRVRFRRNRTPVTGSENQEYYPPGSINLSTHCRGHWWSRWRVPIAVQVESYEPMQ